MILLTVTLAGLRMVQLGNPLDQDRASCSRPERAPFYRSSLTATSILLKSSSECPHHPSTQFHGCYAVSMPICPSYSCLSCILYHAWQICGALTTRTVMHNLMRKEIAIDTKVIPANGTLVPTTHTHPFDALHPRPLVPGRDLWERGPTREAVTAGTSALPRDLDPIT